MKVFVLTGQTESGDDVGPYVWLNKPTQSDIDNVFMRDLPHEVEADCLQCYRVEEAIVEDEGK